MPRQAPYHDVSKSRNRITSPESCLNSCQLFCKLRSWLIWSGPFNLNITWHESPIRNPIPLRTWWILWAFLKMCEGKGVVHKQDTLINPRRPLCSVTILGKLHLRALPQMDWIVSPTNSYIEALTPSTSECGFIWKCDL